MAVIIRLQNLSLSATSPDIRQYFWGLSIPKGGVHIVGGEFNDAFILFSTDEDARRALMLDGGWIRDRQIKLQLSSHAEMETVTELAREGKAVLIRLQNLSWSATAPDIRQYFRGLSIPKGGVHIVGGEFNDAFIIFNTDEDARRALMLDGGWIRDRQIKLQLSSRAEMETLTGLAREGYALLKHFIQLAKTTPPAAATTTNVPATADVFMVSGHKHQDSGNDQSRNGGLTDFRRRGFTPRTSTRGRNYKNKRQRCH